MFLEFLSMSILVNQRIIKMYSRLFLLFTFCLRVLKLNTKMMGILKLKSGPMFLILHISQSVKEMIGFKMLVYHQCLVHLWCKLLVRELSNTKVYLFHALLQVSLQSLILLRQMLTFASQTILKQHLIRFILISCSLVVI